MVLFRKGDKTKRFGIGIESFSGRLLGEIFAICLGKNDKIKSSSSRLQFRFSRCVFRTGSEIIILLSGESDESKLLSVAFDILD